MESPREFLSSFKPAVDVFNSNVEQGAVIRILTHNDADGVASGGIMSNVAKRVGAPFKTTVEKRLDEQILRGVAEEKPSLVVLTDFGSGYLELVGKTLPDVELSPLGLVGALGDQQDKGKKKSLKGVNTLIEEEATAAGLLSKDVDLIFYGHETRPIAKAISNTTTPFIPGLSGREDSSVAFPTPIDIPPKTAERK